MALCQYCGKVEIAWLQVDRKWIACHAQLNADGSVVRTAVRSGLRTVMRPVPNEKAPHYPIPTAWAPETPRGTYCPEWTPAKAAARVKGKMGRRWTPVPSTAPVYVAASEPASVPTTEYTLGIPRAAAPIPTMTVYDEATLEPEDAPEPARVEPKRIPEPEELIGKMQRDAWKRAEQTIRCAILPTRVMLWGPPGTGKTELPWRIAQGEEWTHVYQLMTEETPGTELLGHLIVQGGSTVWCDGTLGRAIRASHTGHVVYVIDEIGRASQDAQSACLLALTNPESLRLTLRSGEVIAPKPEHWHCVATSNDPPEMLAPALADRLHISVKLLAPNPELVRSMTTGEARRLACAASREYSVRALLTYDRLVASGMSMTDAARLVWEPEVAESFLDAARLERGDK